MPNIQFNAIDDIYFWHKNLKPDEKREVNDILRKTLKREKTRRERQKI